MEYKEHLINIRETIRGKLEASFETSDDHLVLRDLYKFLEQGRMTVNEVCIVDYDQEIADFIGSENGHLTGDIESILKTSTRVDNKTIFPSLREYNLDWFEISVIMSDTELCRAIDSKGYLTATECDSLYNNVSAILLSLKYAKPSDSENHHELHNYIEDIARSIQHCTQRSQDETTKNFEMGSDNYEYYSQYNKRKDFKLKYIDKNVDWFILGLEYCDDDYIADFENQHDEQDECPGRDEVVSQTEEAFFGNDEVVSETECEDLPFFSD